MACQPTPPTASSGSRMQRFSSFRRSGSRKILVVQVQGAYLALWGIFTLILLIGSLKMSHALQFVLGTLGLVFFLEAAGTATGTGLFTVVAGYIGIISGLAAIYTALAPVLNDIYGSTVAPSG